ALQLRMGKMQNLLDSNAEAADATSATVSELEADKLVLQSRIDRLQNTLDSNEGAVAATSETVEKLESQKAALQSRIGEMQNLLDINAEAASAANANVAELGSLKEALQLKLGQMQGLLEANANEADVNVENLESQKATLLSQIAELQISVSTNEASLAAESEANSALQTASAELEAVNLDLASQVTDLNAARDATLEQMSALETEQASLNMQLASLETDHASLLEQVSGLELEKVGIQEQLVASNNQATESASSSQFKIDGITQQLNSVVLDRDGLLSEVVEMGVMVGDLEGQLIVSTDTVASSASMIDALESDLSAAAVAAEAANVASMGLQDGFEQQLSDEEAKRAALDAELVETENRVLDLEVRKAALETDKLSLEAQVQQMEDTAASLELELVAAGASNQKLASDLADADAITLGLRDEVRNEKENVSGEQARVADLSGQLATITEQSAAERNRAIALRDAVEQNLRDNSVENVQVTVRDDNGVVINLPSQTLFNSGRARLSAAGRALMNRVASSLNGLDNDIVVEGHTDSIPVSGDLQAIFPSNWELSVARAANSVNFLESEGGVDSSRLGALGYGQQRPVASNETREGRALNRRVELVVKP
ncbi:MAG: flagellar motor protein MotB, partial [Granulosicoccus sp.]